MQERGAGHGALWALGHHLKAEASLEASSLGCAVSWLRRGEERGQRGCESGH